MINKYIPYTFAVIAIFFGSYAHAGSFSGPGATTLSPAAGATQSCATLTNDISIQLSAGVHAGYTCTLNTFNAATCHESGTNKSQTINCTYTAEVDVDDIIIGYTPSDDQCPARAVGEDVTPTTATFVGRIAFQGASGGGTVSPVNLRGNTCDGPTAESLTN